MTKRVAVCGLLVALALVCGYIEFVLPLPIGIPGMKPGLANLVILTALYLLGPKTAAGISLIRIVLSTLLFGSLYGMLYSLAGGVLSLLLMAVCYRYPVFSPIGVSMLGGIAHNIGQLLVAFAFLGVAGVVSYLVPLILAGAVTGFLVGTITRLLLPQARKLMK